VAYRSHGTAFFHPAGGAGNAAIRLKLNPKIHVRPDISVAGLANDLAAANIVHRQRDLSVRPDHFRENGLADYWNGNSP